MHERTSEADLLVAKPGGQWRPIKRVSLCAQAHGGSWDSSVEGAPGSGGSGVGASLVERVLVHVVRLCKRLDNGHDEERQRPKLAVCARRQSEALHGEVAVKANRHGVNRAVARGRSAGNGSRRHHRASLPPEAPCAWRWVAMRWGDRKGESLKLDGRTIAKVLVTTVGCRDW